MCSHKKIPSEEEQKMVYDYCNIRPLERPDITVITAIRKWLVISFAEMLFSIGFSCLLMRFDCLFFNSIWKTSLVLLLFFNIIVSRFICIDCVMLYQHYAPEEIRRRCLLKPTCSEYAIIALKKYGTIIGGCKIIYRLKFKCRGFYYYVDEP